MERRLAAILAADVVGYSKMMGSDEEAALAMWSARREIVNAIIDERGGRVFGSAGDSVIAEFTSSVEAVRCAVVIQQQMQQANEGLTEADQMIFRIGVNFGDVMLEDDDVFGDGVNIAARLEGLAPAGGICISGQVHEQISSKLDAAFAGAGRHSLKNIEKPVDVWCWPPASAAGLRRSAANWQRMAAVAVLASVVAVAVVYMTLRPGEDAAAPTGPRIAVIPFKNLGGAQADAFFSDGLTKDINALLSKFSNLFVIAPSSVAGFRDNAHCTDIRNELQADYMLEGTVRRSSDDLRVTTTFTDVSNCRQLDAPGPFDRDLSVSSILDVQLEIAKKVVAAVGSADAPLFNTQVQNVIRGKAPESLQAYECVLLSFSWVETFASDRLRKSTACLERTLAAEPSYSIGWSTLALNYIDSKKYSIDTPSDWASLSREAANRAISIDPDNPHAYYALAILAQMTGENSVVFRNFAEKAIALNPNDAFVLADLGTWMAYSGAWEQGKEWVSRAKLLNPKHQSWLDYIWHLHHYLKGEYQEARDVALKVNLPDNHMVQASLTAACAMNGEQKKAEQSLAHVLEISPDYAGDPRAPFRTRGMPEELIEGLMDGLRKAGLQVPPEGE